MNIAVSRVSNHMIAMMVGPNSPRADMLKARVQSTVGIAKTRMSNFKREDEGELGNI